MKETSLSFCIFRLDLAVDGQSCEGVGPIIEVAFFRSLIKLRDGFVNGKFKTIFAFILFGFLLGFYYEYNYSEAYNFGKVRIIVLPGLHHLIRQHLLISRGHIVWRRCGVGGQLNVSRQAWIDWSLLCDLSFLFKSLCASFLLHTIFSRSTQVKAVITVRCHAKRKEKD
jgi:hypothetical protein